MITKGKSWILGVPRLGLPRPGVPIPGVPRQGVPRLGVHRLGWISLGVEEDHTVLKSLWSSKILKSYNNFFGYLEESYRSEIEVKGSFKL